MQPSYEPQRFVKPIATTPKLASAKACFCHDMHRSCDKSKGRPAQGYTAASRFLMLPGSGAHARTAIVRMIMTWLLSAMLLMST